MGVFDWFLYDKQAIEAPSKGDPGILQSEIKKGFSADMENIVGLAHWHNYQEGRVRREKKGRSFQLWVVE